jgi:hypothetical protein
MSAEAFDPCPSCRRYRSYRWTWGSLTAVVVGVVAALASGRGPRKVEAQGVKPAAVEIPAHVYKQETTTWSDAAEMVNWYARRGWEPFQVVPLANPNPGAGGPPRVGILFRRPAEGAR